MGRRFRFCCQKSVRLCHREQTGGAQRTNQSEARVALTGAELWCLSRAESIGRVWPWVGVMEVESSQWILWQFRG